MNRDRVRKLHNNPTDAEKTLWAHLRQRQTKGHKFRRQYPIGPYVVDFVCIKRRLVVEVDGGQHIDGLWSDSVRSDWLESQGFRVLRFWNNQVFIEPDGVKAAIVEALESQ